LASILTGWNHLASGLGITHGSTNNTSKDEASSLPVEHPLFGLNIQRSPENISMLTELAKRLVHEIYGCLEGTLGCLASNRMTDLLYGSLISVPEQTLPTDNITEFMHQILNHTTQPCPIRQTCVCTLNDISSYGKLELKLPFYAPIVDIIVEIHRAMGCLDHEDDQMCPETRAITNILKYLTILLPSSFNYSIDSAKVPLRAKTL